MMTSVEKSVRQAEYEERRYSGPLPAACLGAGTAKAREIREVRARNLNIIKDNECSERYRNERVVGKRRCCAHALLISPGV